jgi:hypothetical protein
VPSRRGLSRGVPRCQRIAATGKSDKFRSARGCVIRRKGACNGPDALVARLSPGDEAGIIPGRRTWRLRSGDRKRITRGSARPGTRVEAPAYGDRRDTLVCRDGERNRLILARRPAPCTRIPCGRRRHVVMTAPDQRPPGNDDHPEPGLCHVEPYQTLTEHDRSIVARTRGPADTGSCHWR